MTSRYPFAIVVVLALSASGQCFGQSAASDTARPAKSKPFDLDASVSVAGNYIDNIFSTENDRKGDFVTIISPEAKLIGRSENFKLEIDASAEIGRFATEKSEEYDDALLAGEVQWDLSKKTFLFGGADHSWEHEERSSPDDLNGAEPGKYRGTRGFAGIGTKIGRLKARIGFNHRDFNFDDTPVGDGGFINNDDRDRQHIEVGALLGYTLGKDKQVYVQGAYDHRDYDLPLDDFGFIRDSEGFNVSLGYQQKMGPVEVEVSAGVLRNDYDDPRFETVTVPDFGARIVWRPDNLSRVSVKLDRSLEESTLFGASGYIRNIATLSMYRWIARDLQATGYLSYGDYDYKGIDRDDVIAGAGLGLRYYIITRIFVDTGFSFEERTSDAAGADYNTHTVYLRLGASLDRKYTGSDGLASGGISGFYGGMQMSDGLLKTSVDGPRGSNGSLVAEFGDFGLSGSAFLGYRLEVGGLILGLEVDGGLSSLDWQHSGNRDFSIEAKNSIGASLLVGLNIRNDVLLYGRAGVIGTTFETAYTRGDNSAIREKRDIGMRFGVGAEFPLTDNLSGRMEYQLASYDDHNLGVPEGGNQDNFASIANAASFGLVYHFGARTPSPPEPVKIGGAYVGLQAGHGALGGENAGPRPDADNPAFVLVADRASMGTIGGVFAGYGGTFGPLYLGAELSAEFSNVDWDIEREPNGRFFSVRKNGSIGASVRIGIVVRDAILIYGRAGAINSWFRTNYAFRDVTVDLKNSDVGLRVGAGVEFPISVNLRMRLDYSRTDYSRYTVDYDIGVDDFDNSENLFRIGISYTF